MTDNIDIPYDILKAVQDNQYFGRMNDASGAAYVKGVCGDEMEFYLIIDSDKIKEIKYYTDGCLTTKACGAMAAHLAKGKTIEEAKASVLEAIRIYVKQPASAQSVDPQRASRRYCSKL